MTFTSKRTPVAEAAKPARGGSASVAPTSGTPAGIPLFLQPKLPVSQPGDAHERAADRVADDIAGAPQSAGDTVRNEAALPPAGVVPSLVHDVLSSSGQPLDAAARATTEPRLGHDFSDVRVHTDAPAAQSARVLGAQAYTVGQDIVFAGGQYAPQTTEGRRLLAHELTHVVQQRGSTPVLQRKDGPNIQTVGWKEGVEIAEKAAGSAKTRKDAQGYYKELIVRAAQKVTAPAPLMDRKPTAADIVWNWAIDDFAATADPKKVDNAPDDYWRWIAFSPASVQKDEAYTVSTLLHELDHAAHARALYDEWKKAGGKKGTWDEFYLAHFVKWTEPAIKVKESGMAGALAGLPDKIRPSAIEFRAYATQFVNYFHKLSVDHQSGLARALMLFYPLRTQKVAATIIDPALDLGRSRQQILDYFKSPPVKDKTQQAIVKNRVATELKSALILFRPDADVGQIKTDFKEIMEYELDSEERKEARRNYKPEAL